MTYCAYPNCHNLQQFIPVISIPTIRTKGETEEMVETDKPTLLIGQPICLIHKQSYNLLDWVNLYEWKRIEEAAIAKGFKFDTRKSVIITFRPAGWNPSMRYLELERP